MTTAPLLVVQTFFCAPSRQAGAHYEIHVAPEYREPPRGFHLRHLCLSCTVLVTTDDAAYQDALDAEGTAVHVIAHYHDEARTHVLDRLEVA